MRQTSIHIPSFQGGYKTGLVFSMIEGLKDGESFKLVCDQNPVELEVLLKDARVPNLRWKTQQGELGRWELFIQKEDPSENRTAESEI